jgi:hypothetical protein
MGHKKAKGGDVVHSVERRREISVPQAKGRCSTANGANKDEEQVRCTTDIRTVLPE